MVKANTPRGGNDVPRKWRWHHRALLTLRDRLLEERGARLREAAEPIERHSMSEADAATDEFDRDRALRELTSDQVAIYEVDEALRRIVAGTYGVCEVTGRRIPAARLKAVPWARFARDVEARLEREGVNGRQHLGTLGFARDATDREKTGDFPGEEPGEALPEVDAMRGFSGAGWLWPAPAVLRKTPARGRGKGRGA